MSHKKSRNGRKGFAEGARRFPLFPLFNFLKFLTLKF